MAQARVREIRHRVGVNSFAEHLLAAMPWPTKFASQRKSTPLPHAAALQQIAG
jgi:hypothetical protein